MCGIQVRLKKNWMDLGVLLLFTALMGLSFAGWGRPVPEPASPTPTATARPAWHLVARYTPKPGTRRQAWSARIGSDGKLTRDWGPTLELRPEQVRALEASLRDERLDELKTSYGQGGDTLELALDGHSVAVSDPAGFKQNREVRRFLRVWAEVLTVSGSPNGDKPIDFLRL